MKIKKICFIIVFIVLIVFFLQSLRQHYNKRNREPLFHMVVVCTPNYDIGVKGVKAIRKYCKLHKYKFTLIEEAIKGLHVNFTKNSAAITVLKTTNADFVVNIDADIQIHDFSKSLKSLLPQNIKRETVFYAPPDKYYSPDKRGSVINAGFIIWKNCDRAIKINQIWLDKARNECKKIAQKHPRQQNVFDNCVLPLLKQNELEWLDSSLVAMTYSKFISQLTGSEKRKQKKRDRKY